jgi:uncharacterized membrane protein
MMSTNLLKRIGLLATLYLFLASCEYNVEEEGIAEDPCATDISFSATIRPIIDNNCIQCHNGTVHPFDFRIFAIVQNNAPRIKELTQARIMPKEGSLTSEEIALIGCWVDNGAQNN